MPLATFTHQPSKIAKSIRKKKGASATSTLHANSRDARRLNRSALRDEKLFRHALARDKVNEKYLQRVAFFKDAVDEVLTTDAEMQVDADLMGRLATTFVSRHDEELAQIVGERRVGRPASAREGVVRGLVQEDKEELRSGFWMPDLREESVRQELKLWDGGWSSLGRVRFVRVSVDGKGVVGVRESRFPPNGLS